MEIIYKDESYRIVGTCFEVYKEMGYGFLEAVYHECLEMELASQDIPVRPKSELVLRYKGRELKHKYVPDFISYDTVIIEIKAATALSDAHRTQVHNYLMGTGYKLALLVNFGNTSASSDNSMLLALEVQSW